jgi:asparagine synthase (glutamine-hydrolysing)
VSGILSILNIDGSPVDRRLLRRLTDSMAFRGPDRQEIWTDGQTGFGHALLQTTTDTRPDRQPCTLDGRVWITADARIDDRKTLRTKLLAARREVDDQMPDVELICHAYAVWGTKCVEHLLGDFAFVIWDSRRRQLFCARDHFGIKALYYGFAGRTLVISNTLSCIRAHPTIGNGLNDQAIADFLLFAGNLEPTTTAFEDIQRVPAAHALRWSSKLDVWRYWALPIENELQFRKKEEYKERFCELFGRAVKDRLRCDHVAVSMSGGMDSTAVAAIAKKQVEDGGLIIDLRAFTMIYDHLIPDREREFTNLAATALDVPVHFLVADTYELFQKNHDRREVISPAPSDFPFEAVVQDYLSMVEERSRVMLTGEGGDTLFGAPNLDASYLAREPRLWRAAARSAIRYLMMGRIPRFGIRTGIRRWHEQRSDNERFPQWLRPDVVRRLGLLERWQTHIQERCERHPSRPDAYTRLLSPFWQGLFEDRDPGSTGKLVESRHPLFDRRLVEFLLRIPPVPWFVNKRLLRVTMRDLLPGPICSRPKTALGGDPAVELLSRPSGKWLDEFEPASLLRHYIIRERIPPIYHERNPSRLWRNIRPVALNYWFNSFDEGDTYATTSRANTARALCETKASRVRHVG